MSSLMRCPFCGLLQDEPGGVKSCSRCGGGLEYETQLPPGRETYLQVQMELDQVAAPARVNVERYLLVTIRTPKEVPPEQMPPVKQGRPPVNFSVVLDISGSMQGEKIEQAMDAVRQAVRYLRSGDIFSLVTFNNDIACPFEPIPVDDKTVEAVEDCLRKVFAGGMTALDGGLGLGIKKALTNKLDTNLVMLLSDGQTNVGETDLELIGSHAREARQQGVMVSALGLGLDYNEALLAEIAGQGGGRFYHLQHAHQIPAYVAGELKEVATLAARDVQIHLTIPPGATLIPLSSTFPVQQERNQAVVAVGDIPCDTELEVPLRLALLGQAPGSKRSVESSLTFRSPVGHELEHAINRVTVRFMQAGKFSLREGVVAPVVERVLAQMQAVNVLGMARVMARQPDQAPREESSSLRSIRAYASLLGEERAEAEVDRINLSFSELHDRSMAKNVTAGAFTALRRGKSHE